MQTTLAAISRLPSEGFLIAVTPPNKEEIGMAKYKSPINVIMT